MKERPILFSGAMVRAILDGRKTMTRRVVKPCPIFMDTGIPPLFDGVDFADDVRVHHCPYGQAGDRLWVREKWWNSRGDDSMPTYYAADQFQWNANDWQCHDGPWRPSIHMPRWASRIVLEVVSVRVERLRDISEDDAVLEGIEPTLIYEAVHPCGAPAELYSNRVDEFNLLWDSINAKRGFGWLENPWVWVIEFRRVDKAGKAGK